MRHLIEGVVDSPILSYLSFPPPICHVHLGVYSVPISVMFPYRPIYNVFPICSLCNEVFDTMYYVPIKKDGAAIITVNSPLIPYKRILVWVKGLYVLIKLVSGLKAW